MSARVLVLGAGAVGSAAARYAARSSVTAAVLVADRDPAAAGRAADTAGHASGTPVDAVAVDVTDPAALDRVLDGADVVLNCVGPFYRFAVPVLQAAIRTGTCYLDVCDDWEPTLEMLALDEQARAAGTTAVVGQGASPGTSNMLAKAVAEAVGEPRQLVTGWSLDDDVGGPASAANEHWLQQATGTIRVWRGGRYVDEPPLQEVAAHYPGLPPRPALTIGHPEAVTLPRRWSAMDTCLNVMTLPVALAATLRRAAAAVDEGRRPLRRAAAEVLSEHVPGSASELPEYPGVWALGVGADGRTAAARLGEYGDMKTMGTVTAAPLVAGMELVLAGRCRTGVSSPEDAFVVEDYFPALARTAGVDGEVMQLTGTAPARHTGGPVAPPVAEQPTADRQ